jgi:antitoxin (DNA-binding transcriptional repressor) of toxin-antitoxin stability system
MTVELHDAETKLSELADSAAGGEEVILVRDGKPVAKLTKVPTDKPKRTLGGLEGYGFRVPDDFDTMGQREIDEMFYGEE